MFPDVPQNIIIIIITKIRMQFTGGENEMPTILPIE